jgi:hypothetical protein
MDVLAAAAFLAILTFWLLGIWLGYEKRRRHMPRDGHKESSDPSLF